MCCVVVVVVVGGIDCEQLSQTETVAGAFIRDHRADLQWGLSWLQDSVNPQPILALGAVAGAGIGGIGGPKPLTANQLYQQQLASMGLTSPGLLAAAGINPAAPKIQRQKSAPQTLDALRQWLAEPSTPANANSKPAVLSLSLPSLAPCIAPSQLT